MKVLELVGLNGLAAQTYEMDSERNYADNQGSRSD